MKLFNEKDFEQAISNSKFSETLRMVVNIANQKIEKYLGPKVYMSQFIDQKTQQKIWAADQEKTPQDTHEGYLFDIKQIENIDCTHIPEIITKEYGKEHIEIIIPYCIKCRKKINAVKWTP
jgi:hypothetical protein